MTDEVTHSEHRSRLGQGLATLLGATRVNFQHPVNSHEIRNAPIELLRPNASNPRKHFDDRELDELTASIRERGIIQPILVRKLPSTDAYEIIAGERRWRAAQRAAKHEVPIIVLHADEREALEIAIVENVQRVDLCALDEATGYVQLIEDYGYTHSDLARVTGKSRSHIVNTLRLLNLPAHTRDLLSAGQISAGHARALLSVPQPDGIADRVVAEQLTVRAVERLGKNVGRSRRTRRAAGVDADTLALQNRLSLVLGAKVTIWNDGGSGQVRIAFRDFDQLDEVCRRLCQFAPSHTDPTELK